MRRLMLAGAVMAAVGCASEPSAAVKVTAHKVGAEGAGDGHVESPPSALHPLTPTDEALATTTTTLPPTTTTTEPVPVTTAPTTVYEAVPSPQGRTTGRGSEPPAGDVWASLADCESGSQNVDTGNGYSGYFQFSDATWRSMGTGYARAVDAPYSVQLSAAQRLQARSGWGQWPACTRQMGLS